MNAIAEIDVELITPAGESLGQASVNAQQPARDIAAALAEHCGLPLMREGRRVDYDLFWEQQGRNVPGDSSLQHAGVQRGDRLKLVSSVPVGSGGGDRPAPLPAEPERTAQTVRVNIELMVDGHRGRKLENEQLPLDVPVSSLIDGLVKSLQLPSQLYSLRSKATGQILHDSDTLRSRGIPNNDALTLTAEKPAGLTPRVSRRRRWAVEVGHP